MGRALRLEFAGALYHVTSRGDRREDIYEDDIDRFRFLELLGEVCDIYRWECHSYCLMSNHYHLLIETVEGNLSKGMRQINGVYSQNYNRRHAKVGHVFQGRYKAILVEKESYLLELSRYIILNPVRACMVDYAQDWPWSSYRAMISKAPKQSWLNIDWILSSFHNERSKAINAYIRFVSQGKWQPSPWGNLKNQLFLGSNKFVAEKLALLDCSIDLTEIPKLQRRKLPRSLVHYRDIAPDRNAGIIAAYRSGGYTQKEIGKCFELSYSMVSRIIKNSKFKT